MVQDQDSTQHPAAPSRAIAAARLTTGLLQGLALYLLYSASEAKVWPAINGEVFAPLLFTALFLPLIVIQGLHNLRLRTLVVWSLIAAILIATLTWYQVWHSWPAVPSPGKEDPRSSGNYAFFVLGLYAMLFIAHALISGGDHDRRFMARYETYFDVAWKLALQVALGAVFVGAFWALLWLGAGLFSLLKIEFFTKLLVKDWFWIPVTALATATALHLTDMRPALVRGTRSLLLSLLSFLLPLMAVIASGFLATLLVTGLTPLWETRRAAALLLVSAAALIVLINATWQDGASDRTVTRIFRLGATVAALALTPLSLLAAYALTLRVAQYGWTTDRVALAACVLLALCYALGYAIAVFRKTPWFSFIAKANFLTALAGLAILFACFSPIADPARISVASQMARLESGRVSPEKFDVTYLRREGGRFGKAALENLRDHSPSQILRSRAKDAMADPRLFLPAPKMTITIYPQGRKLPDSFLRQSWPKSEAPRCPYRATADCEALLLDLDGDGKEEILTLGEGNTVFTQEPDGKWTRAGYLAGGMGCDGVREALRQGKLTLVPLQMPRWRQIEIKGTVLWVELFGLHRQLCPPKPSPAR